MAAQHGVAKQTVVFLHGLARGRGSIARLQQTVEKAGYRTWNRSYPSRHASLAKLTEEIEGWIKNDLGADFQPGELIAVTHSMGAILARLMTPRIRWRGVVMIAPPNQGSQVARSLKNRAAFQRIFGPAGQELTNPAGWPPPPDPFFVIAGTRGLALLNPTSWVSRGLRIFPAGVASDGTVAVEETRLPNMADFATVDASHPWITNHPRTQQLVLEYLRRINLGPAPCSASDPHPRTVS